MSVSEKELLINQVDHALNDIRPHLAVDGGNVEVVDITDDHIVKIKWMGNCVNCAMSFMTLKAGLEQTLQGKMPQIKGVEAIN